MFPHQQTRKRTKHNHTQQSSPDTFKRVHVRFHDTLSPFLRDAGPGDTDTIDGSEIFSDPPDDLVGVWMGSETRAEGFCQEVLEYGGGDGDADAGTGAAEGVGCGGYGGLVDVVDCGDHGDDGHSQESAVAEAGEGEVEISFPVGGCEV